MATRKVSVTGATGFLAEALIQDLVSRGYEINAISRNEGKLVELKSKFEGVNIFPCPIEDYCLLKKAISNSEGIYHLAAFKDVILSGQNPLKTVQTNILGTLNILKLSTENRNIKYVIATSSDKAAKISSVYGATKLILEKLFEEFDVINHENCKYRVVRYGNVFYSTASVLVKWKKAILSGGPITITDPSATRFFWTREDAVKLLFDCLENSVDSRPCIPNMKSVTMGELLEVMIERYANGRPVNIKEIGLQVGENLHEYLTDSISSGNSDKWKKEELKKIL